MAQSYEYGPNASTSLINTVSTDFIGVWYRRIVSVGVVVVCSVRKSGKSHYNPEAIVSLVDLCSCIYYTYSVWYDCYLLNKNKNFNLSIYTYCSLV